MYYGDEKALQMSRSLLPSTARKSAREEKKIIARRKRRKVKQALHKIKCEEDYYEENLDFDYQYDAKWERSYMVRERQSADKIGPFINWAKAKAAHIPDGEKLDYIRSILPGSGFIIIDHALSHLEWVEGFEKNPLEFWSWWRYGRKNRDEIRREDVLRALHEIAKNRKLVEILNNLIRKLHAKTYWYRHKKTEVYRYPIIRYVDGEKVIKGYNEEVRHFYHDYDKTIGARVLMGAFDVDDFFDDIERASYEKKFIPAPKGYCHSDGSKKVENPQHNPKWRNAVRVFVDAWLTNPNDFEALRALVGYDYAERYRYYQKTKHSYCWNREFNWKW